MKKFNKEAGYLVLEGLVAFFLITTTISMYFPIITTVLQRLEVEKNNVEKNRKRMEQVQIDGGVSSKIILKGIEWNEV